MRASNDTNNLGTGIGFIRSSQTNDIGAAIIFKRTDAQTKGELQFYTKQSNADATDPVQVMVLSDSGKVGINTTTPQNTLNVVGDINFTGLIYGNGSQLTDIGGASPGGTEGAIQFYDGGNLGGNASQFFINKTSGNVGIGETSPSEKLTISGGNISLTTANSYITGATAYWPL